LDGGFGSLVYRIEWPEMSDPVRAELLCILHPAQNRAIDRVLVLGARRQRSAENDLVGGDALHAERLTQRQLVLG
jgi:hypothetical protein